MLLRVVVFCLLLIESCIAYAMQPAGIVQGNNDESSAHLNSMSPTKAWYPVAITTNLLYDIAVTPNIGLRVPVGDRLVIGADWMYARWHRTTRHRYWHIWGGDLELQYRIGKVAQGHGRFAGHHVGVYASLACYDFQFGARPGVLSSKYNYAAGLSYAYSMPVSRRLNIEFSVGVGYLWGHYKKHRPIDDHDVWQSTHRMGWFGPTRVGVSLVWTLGGCDSDLNKKGGTR